MGLFGSRKETYVSSVVYNMAGDEKDRVNYLKTTVIGSVLHNRPSIAGTIKDSYLEGPGIRFRTFMRWSRRTNYSDVIGFVTGSLSTGDNIDMGELNNQVPVTPGSTPNLQTAVIDNADYTYWVDQFVSENYPERLGSEYVSDFNEQANEITITWVDEDTTTFTPVGFNALSKYLYVTYVESTGDIEEPIETGDVVNLDPEDDFPDTTGWTEISYEEDGGDFTGEWQKTIYHGKDPDSDFNYSIKEYMFQTQEGTDRYYRIDTQKILHGGWSPIKVFIYEYGSGNTVLDDMFKPDENIGDFFPFIPFRLDNKFVSPDYLPNVYEQSKKAYKKSVTGKYDKTIEDLKDNESLDDIDFAYAMFGVSLNVKENACKKYIYQFFKTIMENQSLIGSPEYEAWKSDFNEAKQSWDDWFDWKYAQADPENPGYGGPEPTRIPYPEMPINSIRIWSGNNPVMNFDMTISWAALREDTGGGLYKPDAKVGEVSLDLGGTETYEQLIWTQDGPVWAPSSGTIINNDVITISWQVTPTFWRRIRITGLKHKNMVYRGKAVEISAKEALEDVEESGFIIPLHEGIYKEMGLIDGTQMSTACAFMVFNCYEIVKKKWYQTGIFKVILIIIIIVVSIYTGGLGASGAGVLGTNASVGAALGFSGTMATIVGAIANAVAAMLITQAIVSGATALFGEEWGAIIGTIASVIAIQVGTNMMQGQSFSASFGDMMKADNILKLTMAAGDGYAGYLRDSTQSILEETQSVIEKYEEEVRQLQALWAENIGYNRGIIDPMELTDIFGVTMESVDSFLQRTLMTGSDVAELSLEMLTNFVDMTLSTELPT